MEILRPENRQGTLTFLKKHLPLSLPALAFVEQATPRDLEQCRVSPDAFLRVAPDGQLLFIGNLARVESIPATVNRIYAEPANAQRIWERIRKPGQEPFFVRELYFHLPLSDAEDRGPDADTRPLAAEDFPAWYRCYEGLLRDWGAPESWISPSVEKIFLQRVKDGQVMGLFRGPDLVSTAALSEVHDGWSRIGWVYTAPDHRKQGLAQKVMRSLLHRAREMGIRDLALYTNEKNYRAHHLYEPMGFRVVGDVGIVGIR